MTYQELAAEVVRLPLKERLILLELVSRSVREDLKSQRSTTSLVARLRGIARSETAAPTDDEIENDYVTYLEQKYS